MTVMGMTKAMDDTETGTIRTAITGTAITMDMTITGTTNQNKAWSIPSAFDECIARHAKYAWKMP